MKSNLDICRKIFALILFLLSTLTVHSAALANISQRGAPVEADAHPPKVEHFRLSNGIGVWFVQRQGSGKLRAKMIFRAREEATCKHPAGTAEIMATLITKGTKFRSGKDLDSEVGRLGGFLASAGGAIETHIDVGARLGHLDETLDLWADSIRNPAFRDAEFEAQKYKYTADVEVSAADPRELSVYAMDRALWRSCPPFGQWATPQTIATIRRNDVVEFYKKQFESAKPYILAVGDISASDLHSKLEIVFTGWRPRQRFHAPKMTASTPMPPRVILIDKPDASDVRILGGRVIPSFDPKNEPAVNLFIAVLGQTTTSRLYTNLTEERGWAEYSAAYMRPMPRSRYLTAKANDVKVERMRDVILEIKRELRDIVSEYPVTAEELERERNAWIQKAARFPWNNDEAVLIRIQSIAVNDLPIDYLAKNDNSVRRVTLRNAQVAGKKLLPDTNMTWVVVGDLSRIESAVRDMNIGEVEVQDNFGRRLR